MPNLVIYFFNELYRDDEYAVIFYYQYHVYTCHVDVAVSQPGS